MSRGQGEREGSRAGLDLVITRLEPCGGCEMLETRDVRKIGGKIGMEKGER